MRWRVLPFFLAYCRMVSIRLFTPTIDYRQALFHRLLADHLGDSFFGGAGGMDFPRPFGHKLYLLLCIGSAFNLAFDQHGSVAVPHK